MSDSRKQGQAFALLLAVFLIGVGTGGVGMRAFEHEAHQGGPENPEVGTDTSATVERMATELDLQPDQVAKIKAILDKTIMDEADLLHKVRLIQDSGRDRILEQLDPDQRVKFEDMSKQAALQ